MAFTSPAGKRRFVGYPLDVKSFRLFAPIAAFFSVLLLTACHGASTPPPVIPPGPKSPCALTPGQSGMTATAPPCPAGTVAPSQYTADGNPGGMTVTVNGKAQGATPATLDMPFATTPYTITFQPPITLGANSYTYTVQQNGDGPHTLYFNALADTSGSLTNVSATARRRAVPNVRLSGSIHTRAISRADRPAIVPGQLAVYYAASTFTNTGDLQNFEKSFGITSAYTLGPTVKNKVTRIIAVPGSQSSAALSAALRQDPRVLDVLPIHYRYLLTMNGKTPNDQHFDLQWDMQRIGMPNAWAYTFGLRTIPIAIIDSGFDPQNVDIAKKVQYSETVNNGVVKFGEAVDRFGHGTNVSGIAAAVTDNIDGFAGVGWDTTLLEFKVFFPDPSADNMYAEPTANTADIAQSIYDAVAKGARVINMSLGGGGADSFDAVERDAVEFAVSNNVTVVASAGNEGNPALDYPAGHTGVISVGATSLGDGDPGGNGTPAYSASFTDTIASYSNSGPSLSLVAPGGDPTGADITSNTPDLNHWITNLWTTQNPDPASKCNAADCYFLVAGTSQASPHVAGAVALMLSLNNSMTTPQITSVLQSTADDIGDPRQGHGRLNVYRALAAVSGDPAPPTLPFKPNFMAFAYTPSNSSSPQIINLTFLHGVPVNSDGTFRVADIPPNATGYKIGVWFNANGSGVAGPGDFFASTATCAANVPCATASGLTAHPISTGFVFN